MLRWGGEVRKEREKAKAASRSVPFPKSSLIPTDFVGEVGSKTKLSFEPVQFSSH